MQFWIYQNWRAESKAVIHRADCRQCNDGKGCHKNIHGNRNGQWLGPFSTLDAAESAAKATGRPLRHHRCRQPGSL